VVPILVIENKNPFSALKDSTVLLKKTWGERLAANFSFGTVFFVMALPAVALFFLALFSGSFVAIVLAIALGAIYLIVLGLIQSALQSIFQAALFLYARDGQVPAGFEAGLLGDAMRSR
jgi:hypothetical protein